MWHHCFQVTCTWRHIPTVFAFHFPLRRLMFTFLRLYDLNLQCAIISNRVRIVLLRCTSIYHCRAVRAGPTKNFGSRSDVRKLKSLLYEYQFSFWTIPIKIKTARMTDRPYRSGPGKIAGICSVRRPFCSVSQRFTGQTGVWLAYFELFIYLILPIISTTDLDQSRRLWRERLLQIVSRDSPISIAKSITVLAISPNPCKRTSA